MRRRATVIAILACALLVPSAAQARIAFSSCVGGEGFTAPPCITRVSGFRLPRRPVISPDGRFLYAIAYVSGVRELVAFTRDADSGALTPLPMCVDEDPAGRCPAHAAFLGDPYVSPDGRFIYFSSVIGLAWLARDPATGSLSSGGCVREVSYPDASCPRMVHGLFGGQGIPPSLALSPDGRSLYATAVYPQGQLAAFSIDAGTGALTETACFQRAGASGCRATPGIGQPNNVTVTPDGTGVYTGGALNLAIFTRDASGGLTYQSCIGDAVSASVCPVATAAGSPMPSADGHELFVATGGGLYVYARDTTTNQLTATGCAGPPANPGLGCVANRAQPGYSFEGAVAPDGVNFYAPGHFDEHTDVGDIFEYGHDARSGAVAYEGCLRSSGGTDACYATLDGMGRVTAGLAMSPDGRFLYAAHGRTDVSPQNSAIIVFARTPAPLPPVARAPDAAFIVPVGVGPGSSVPLPAACPAGSGSCSETVKVTRAPARARPARATVIASGQFRVPAGRSVTIRPRFTAAGRALLRRSRRVSALATLSRRTASGVATTLRLRLELRH
jgi:DNA-binding beta-propeller fold protein YncE